MVEGGKKKKRNSKKKYERCQGREYRSDPTFKRVKHLLNSSHSLFEFKSTPLSVCQSCIEWEESGTPAPGGEEAVDA